jgi:hypothetical protein
VRILVLKGKTLIAMMVINRQERCGHRVLGPLLGSRASVCRGM